VPLQLILEHRGTVVGLAGDGEGRVPGKRDLPAAGDEIPF
jgi:hypothetical protein